MFQRSGFLRTHQPNRCSTLGSAQRGFNSRFRYITRGDDYERESDDRLHNPLCLMEATFDFSVVDDDTTTQSLPSSSSSTTTQRPYDSVVVGLAPSQFYYEQLNRAFRVLSENPNNLIAVQMSIED